MTALIEAHDLRVTFHIRREGDMPWTKPRELQAVAGVNFTLNAGETLGIVGESGWGKSTLARALIQMVPATGRVIWQGKTDLLALNAREMLAYRRDIQMVFQDPLARLNPRMTVGQIMAEPLRTHLPQMPASEVKARVQLMMDRVGLLPNQINRYPHEFSGGQCQRIGIARALIVEPKLLICDEPVSALDVSIQAQVINLLAGLQRDFGIAMIFIAHDLSRGQTRLGPGHGDVSGPGDGGCRQARPFRLAAAPLYAGAAVRRADPRSGGRTRQGDDPAGRRSALADEPAFGLRLPHPLLPGRGALRRRSPRPHRRRCLPFPRASRPGWLIFNLAQILRGGGLNGS